MTLPARPIVEIAADPTAAPAADPAADLAAWARALLPRGLHVLPHSHAVPVDVWMRDQRRDLLLHLRARGTRVTLRAYAARDLATAILRAECDCAEHRAAGAAHRSVLVPGAVPLAEAVYAGESEAGWTGIEAGLLRLDGAAALFELLLGRLRVALDHTTDVAADRSDQPRATGLDGSVTQALHEPA